MIDYYCIVREYGSIELRIGLYTESITLKYLFLLFLPVQNSIGSGEMKQPHPPSTMPSQKPRLGRKVRSGGKAKPPATQDENSELFSLKTKWYLMILPNREFKRRSN